MKNLPVIMLMLLVSFTMNSWAQETSPQKTPIVNMTPLVIDVSNINSPNVPSEGVMFCRTRTQEEQLGFVLGNVVSKTKYNKLIEENNLLIDNNNRLHIANDWLTSFLIGTSVSTIVLGVIVFFGGPR